VDLEPRELEEKIKYARSEDYSNRESLSALHYAKITFSLSVKKSPDFKSSFYSVPYNVVLILSDLRISNLSIIHTESPLVLFTK
jgi:hypothetical protein